MQLNFKNGKFRIMQVSDPQDLQFVRPTMIRMLNAAYDICVDKKTKLSFAYVAKILESWHAAGYKTPADVTAGEQKKKISGSKGKADYGSYDLDLFEKMLNKDD